MSSMFPGAGAQIYRNDAGEVLGWDYPSTDPSDFCDRCGCCHVRDCELEPFDEPEEPEAAADDLVEDLDTDQDVDTTGGR